MLPLKKTTCVDLMVYIRNNFNKAISGAYNGVYLQPPGTLRNQHFITYFLMLFNIRLGTIANSVE